MTEQQVKLVEDNHNLIYHYIFKHLYGDIDRWYGILAIALCKAARTFDPAKNIAFSTYACKCMQNEVYKEYRDMNNDKHRYDNDLLSLDYEYDEYSEDKDISLLDRLTDMYPSLEDEVITRISIQSVIDKLSEKSKMIIRLYSLGYTQKYIASMFNISQAQVSRTIKRFISMYDELREDE